MADVTTEITTFVVADDLLFCGLGERQCVDDGAVNLRPIHRIDFDRFALGITPPQVVMPRRRRQEQPLANRLVFVLEGKAELGSLAAGGLVSFIEDAAVEP